LLTYFFLFLGLAVLLVSGEVLVKGAVGIATRLRISKLVVGATVVSIGTSAPELIVSLQAAIEGHPEIAIGNVVGSNIANIALVLGLVLLILPMQVDKNTVRLDWPVMMGASLLFYLMAMDGIIGRFEGSMLFLLLFAYIVYAVRESRKVFSVDTEEDFSDLKSEARRGVGLLVIMIVGGVVGLVFGARWFLQGAVAIAEEFKVSEHLISVTLVAFGTSVPELFTSLVAAIRKQSDISIGNLIGSNTFNILGILGVTSIVKEVEVSQRMLFSDMWWMMGIAFILLPFFLFSKKLNRLQGLILVSCYVLYVFLVISAK
jgi:cation:H+ antiporter